MSSGLFGTSARFPLAACSSWWRATDQVRPSGACQVEAGGEGPANVAMRGVPPVV